MSERQAKLKRKNEVKEIQKKKKNPVDIVINIVIIVLVLAILGVGGWAVYNKFKQVPQQDATAITDTTQMPDAQQAVAPTIAEYAQTEKEMDAETFMAEYGLAGIEGVTAETLMSDAMNHLTLANFAKLSDSDVATVKEQYGLGEEYSEDTLMGDVFAEQMAAEQTETEAVTEETAE